MTGTLLPRPGEIPAWVDQAVCGQADPDAFFPDKGGSTKAAKAICNTCPVRELCLEWALTLPGDHTQGVWGGLTEKERRPLKHTRTTHCRWCDQPFPTGTPRRYYCTDMCRRAARNATQHKYDQARRRVDAA